MFKLKNIAFYVITIVVFAALIYFVLDNGKALESTKNISAPAQNSTTFSGQINELIKHNLFCSNFWFYFQ
jgi:hypothetical protein